MVNDDVQSDSSYDPEPVEEKSSSDDEDGILQPNLFDDKKEDD